MRWFTNAGGCHTSSSPAERPLQEPQPISKLVPAIPSSMDGSHGSLPVSLVHSQPPALVWWQPSLTDVFSIHLSWSKSRVNSWESMFSPMKNNLPFHLTPVALDVLVQVSI